MKARGPRGEDALLLENPREVLDAWLGDKGGILWAVSREDGEKRAAYRLDAPPVFDSLAATSGRLYLSTMTGKVLCFANR
ncbi:MAG: hypothetical protein O7J95_15495 [Planctomycetota bacterium]|nr:hypothetical protein [Planctomycetota bacterium]